jgi:hypothetical protein
VHTHDDVSFGCLAPCFAKRTWQILVQGRPLVLALAGVCQLL